MVEQGDDTVEDADVRLLIAARLVADPAAVWPTIPRAERRPSRLRWMLTPLYWMVTPSPKPPLRKKPASRRG
jgi:hypothetical protein